MASLYGGWPTCNPFLSQTMFNLKNTFFVIFWRHFFPRIIIKTSVRLSLLAITKRRFTASMLPLKVVAQSSKRLNWSAVVVSWSLSCEIFICLFLSKFRVDILFPSNPVKAYVTHKHIGGWYCSTTYKYNLIIIKCILYDFLWIIYIYGIYTYSVVWGINRIDNFNKKV